MGQPVIKSKPSRVSAQFRAYSGQRGFTLVESMVAVMILAIGMVGLAYLQATGMRFTTTSYQRTQASILALDYLDIIRSHRIENADLFALTYAHGTGIGNCVATDGGGASATAENEANCWLTRLQNAIPSASTNITVADDTSGAAASTGTLVSVTITWLENPVRQADPSTQATPIERRFTTSARL